MQILKGLMQILKGFRLCDAFRRFLEAPRGWLWGGLGVFSGPKCIQKGCQKDVQKGSKESSKIEPQIDVENVVSAQYLLG